MQTGDYVIILGFLGFLGFLAYLAVNKQQTTVTTAVPASYVIVPQGLR